MTRSIMIHKKYRVYRGWGRRKSSIQERPTTVIADIEKRRKYGIVILGGQTAYGDAFLGSNSSTFSTERMKSITVVPDKEIAICGGGVTFGELLAVTQRLGLVPCVMPGTLKATVGGAVAVDAHGKSLKFPNCMSNSVNQYLLNTGKEIITVNQTDFLFGLTCGGLGSTGLIDEIHVKLRKGTKNLLVQHNVDIGLKNLLQEMKNNLKSVDFQVAILRYIRNHNFETEWVLQTYRFSNSTSEVFPKEIFQDLFALILLPIAHLAAKTKFTNVNRKLLENVINGRFKKHGSSEIVPLRKGLFRLDSFKSWNLLHGKGGLTQWQRSIPFGQEITLDEVLQEIFSSNFQPTLISLKILQEESKSLLGFCQPGWNIAVDFPFEDETLIKFLQKLDLIVAKVGGKPYLAKDDYLNREMCEIFFQKSYAEFQKEIDRYFKCNSLLIDRLFSRDEIS